MNRSINLNSKTALFSKLKYKVRQYGLIGSIARFIKFVLRILGISYEQYLFCTLPLVNDKLAEKNKPSIDVKVCFLNTSDFRHSQGIKFTKKDIEYIVEKLNKQTYRALGCLYKSKLIYIAWISLKEFKMPSFCPQNIYSLKENEGLLVDAYCHPEYRRFGLHSFMNTKRLKTLYELGKTKAIAVILKENWPARKSQAKVGFKCIKMITCVRIFGRCSSRISENKISLA